jgi:D-alanyl-lipoteichoic acid acyltransferase DltB (MBOAT superfamily)
MVFTSPLFLFIFFPIAWAAWLLFARLSRDNRASLVTITAVSIVFYAWWHIPNLAVLGASIAGNYLLGRLLMSRDGRVRTLLLTIGVTANLALLAVFKYYTFLTGDRVALVLPLAISFFTFTQIAFLVDVSRRQVAEYSFLRYVTFVVFFPHLIAGPIVRLQEIQDQLRDCMPSRLRFDDFREGTALILAGLAKKTLIADTLAPASDVLFNAAQAGHVSAPMAWVGSFCFYLQIYFDFSGYTDIALGLARLFTIRFPENFNYPYSATSIIDFWRRWHMTLSRFLRDYVYIPLGGSRCAPWRRHVNLMITMLVGGLWHGAGWTYIAWGGLHGAGLIVNHLLRQAFPRSMTPAVIKGLVVQAFVFVAWIFFRAPDFASAWRVIEAMPGPWSASDPGLLQMAAATNALFQGMFFNAAFNAGLIGLAALLTAGLITAVWGGVPARAPQRWRGWVTAPMGVGLAAIVLAVLSARVAAGNVIQPFIYFQF